MNGPAAASEQLPARRIPPVAYAVALVAYVALGLVVTVGVLNWVVGPLFPFVVLYVVPRGARALLNRLR